MATAPQKAKKTKKQRKHGRNATRGTGRQNARYKAEHRHEKSHVRRIAKHLKYFPGDKAATAALVTYKARAGIL